ncbi:MAG: hypothetical protein ABI051_16140 [Vicinamibacterales bacterium]
MSERTASALERLDALLPALSALPAEANRDQLMEEATALRRAVAAFHMEAIRFRIHAVDRLLRLGGDAAEPRRLLEDVRQALESAGFHTRSHVAP